MGDGEISLMRLRPPLGFQKGGLYIKRYLEGRTEALSSPLKRGVMGFTPSIAGTNLRIYSIVLHSFPVSAPLHNDQLLNCQRPGKYEETCESSLHHLEAYSIITQIVCYLRAR